MASRRSGRPRGRRRSTTLRLSLALIAAPLSAWTVLRVAPEHEVVAARPGGLEAALPPGSAAVLAEPPVDAPANVRRGEGSATTVETPPVVDVVPVTIDDWIRGLAHDDEQWNAHRSLQELRKIGAPAVPALRQALLSRDRQQRQLAGVLLYDLLDRPEPDLLTVAVEALEHDRLPYDPGWPVEGAEDRVIWIHNAQLASRFLDRHAESARPRLTAELVSGDGQQRFLSACLLAWGLEPGADADATLGRSLETTVSVLAEHLHDNDLPGDGVLAASALARMGAAALPHLRREHARGDDQARTYLGFLIEHARDPVRTIEAARQRIHAHGLGAYVNASEDFALREYTGQTPTFRDRDAGYPKAPPH